MSKRNKKQETALLEVINYTAWDKDKKAEDLQRTKRNEQINESPK